MHQLSDTMFTQPLTPKAEDMLDRTLGRLSLSGGFQPKGILHIGSCQFSGYARYGDMYKADIKFADQSESLLIVAKAFRVLLNDHESNEQCTKMVDMLRDHWSGVGYDNIYISPTWRASVATAGHTVPALATPFYRNGNVFDYVRLHPNADRLDLLCQAASALAHIHSKGVVHGNICPENMCIAEDGTMRVTDIAVDTLVRQGSNRDTLYVPSNWTYKSPEELELGYRTMQTDVYSFAVTIYSVYTLKPPFPSTRHSYGKSLVYIINHGHDGESKPEMMSDGLWEIVQMCWVMDPARRPSMAECNGMLARICDDSR